MSRLGHEDDVRDGDIAVATVAERDLTRIFLERFRELLEGMPVGQPTWVTSEGPEGGIYGTLDALTAEQASQDAGGITAAAHAEHLRWALQLVNDYFDGKEPTANWSASWSVTEVDDEEWDELRAKVRATGERLLANVSASQRWSDEMSLNGALASYGHTAYHLGALRLLQQRITRGES